MVATADSCIKWNKSRWESQMLPKTFCLFFLDFRYIKSHMHRWYEIRCKTIWKSKRKEVKWPGRQCGREYAQSISYTCVKISFCNSRPWTMNIQQGDKKIPKLSDFFSMIQTFSSYAAMLGSVYQRPVWWRPVWWRLSLQPAQHWKMLNSRKLELNRTGCLGLSLQ